MLCAELERLEADFDDIITALEDPDLKEDARRLLQQSYSRLSGLIQEHHKSGHAGRPCYEDSAPE
ncbi:MAG TPA: hypothetical protein VMI10_12030 [Terriglobales bacterium]|nr:hypothetical protein [Terriglobales bacterium]